MVCGSDCAAFLGRIRSWPSLCSPGAPPGCQPPLMGAGDWPGRAPSLLAILISLNAIMSPRVRLVRMPLFSLVGT